MVFWAELRAKKTGLLNTVKGVRRWFGTRGMRWGQFNDRIAELLATSAPPDRLIIHLGGNDLGTVSLGSLIYKIRKDLKKVKKVIPQTHITWSDLTARRHYRHARDVPKVEMARRMLNTKVHKIITDIKGSFIRHDEIHWHDSILYREDGVHLSDTGNDILLSNWAKELLKY